MHFVYSEWLFHLGQIFNIRAEPCCLVVEPENSAVRLSDSVTKYHSFGAFEKYLTVESKKLPSH